jgi:hypothetical protein
MHGERELNLARSTGLACAVLLTGCGTYVPQIEEIWEGQTAIGFEKDVKAHIYCELQSAIQRTSAKGKDLTTDQDAVYVRDARGVRDALPDSWGVQISLSFEVDETGSLNPSALITPAAGNPAFMLGLGATVSSQATRIDKYGFYYAVAPLKLSLQGTGNDDCNAPRNSSLLSGDLGIFPWLQKALLIEAYDHSSPVKSAAFKQDVISYETKFIITTSGSANPAWKLARLTTNQTGSSLLAASRLRTHDLIITFGPTDSGGTGSKKKGTGAQPGLLAANSHLAQDIGLAVSNAIRAGTTVP